MPAYLQEGLTAKQQAKVERLLNANYEVPAIAASLRVTENSIQVVKDKVDASKGAAKQEDNLTKARAAKKKKAEEKKEDDT